MAKDFTVFAPGPSKEPERTTGKDFSVFSPEYKVDREKMAPVPTGYERSVGAPPTSLETMVSIPRAFMEAGGEGAKQVVTSAANIPRVASKLISKKLSEYSQAVQEAGVEVPEGIITIPTSGREYDQMQALLGAIDERASYWVDEPLFQPDQNIAKKYSEMKMYDPRRVVYTGSNAMPQIMASFIAGNAVSSVGMAFSLGQKVAFGAMAAGSYAKQAEAEGTSIEQQAAYGTVMGAVELATEAPYMDYLNGVIGVPGVMRGGYALAQKLGANRLAQFGTGIAAESLQEVVAEGLSGISGKLIYDPERKWVGKGGALDPAGMAEAAYGGAAMGLLVGGMAMPLGSPARQKTEEVVEKVTTGREAEVTVQDVQDIANGIDEDSATEAYKKFQDRENQMNETLQTREAPIRGQRVVGEDAQAVLDMFNENYDKDFSETEMDEDTAGVVDALSRVLDFKYIVAEGDKSTNAFYDPNTDTIVLNTASDKFVPSVVGHEVAHMIERRNPDLYAEFASILESEAVPPMLALARQEVMNTYKDTMDLTPEQVTSEIVARYSEEMFDNPDTIVELAEQNPSLAARIVEYIQEIIEKLKSITTRRPPQMTAMLKDAERVRKEYMAYMEKYIDTRLTEERQDLADARSLLSEIEPGTAEYYRTQELVEAIENQIAGVQADLMFSIEDKAKVDKAVAVGKEKARAVEKVKKVKEEAAVSKAVAVGKEKARVKKVKEEAKVEKAVAVGKEKAKAEERRQKDIEELKERFRKREEKKQYLAEKKKLASLIRKYSNINNLKKITDDVHRNIIQVLVDTYSTKTKTLHDAQIDEIVNILSDMELDEDLKQFALEKGTARRFRQIGKKGLGELSGDEIQALNELIKYVEVKDRNEKAFISEKRIATRDEAIGESIGLMREARDEAEGKLFPEEREGIRETIAGPFRKFMRKSDLQPDNLILQMLGWGKEAENSQAYKLLYKDINAGQAESFRVLYEISDRLQAGIRGIDMTGWSTAKARAKYEFENGSIRLNPDEKITLWLLAKQKDGVRHLIGEGIWHKDSGKKLPLTLDDVTMVRHNFLTKDEKKVADAYSKIYNTTMKQVINATSRELLGFDLAAVENYAPIQVASDAKDTDISKDYRMLKKAMIESSPYLKDRTQSAAAVYIGNASHIFRNAAKFAAEYRGMAIPARNARLLIGSEAFKQEVINRYGTSYLKSLQKYVDDVVLKFERTEELDTALKRLQSRYTTAVLGLNWATGLKQMPSYLYSLAYIEQGPWVARGMANLKMSKNMLMNPFVRARMEGYITRETMESVINQDLTASKQQKILQEARSKGMSHISFFDMKAITAIWNTLEAKMRAKEGKVNLKKLNAEFEEIVFRTQPNYTPAQRSEIMRTGSVGARMMTMFRTQLSTIYNMLYRDFYTARKTGDYKQFAKTSATVMTGSMIIAFVNSLRSRIRDRDPKFWENLVLSIAGLNFFASELANALLTTFSAEVPMTSIINSLYAVVRTNPLDDPAKAFKKTIRAASEVSGIPAENLIKLVEDIFNIGRGVSEKLS